MREAILQSITIAKENIETYEKQLEQTSRRLGRAMRDYEYDKVEKLESRICELRCSLNDCYIFIIEHNKKLAVVEE